MATITSKGRISARIAHTFAATTDYAAAKGDPVHVVGDYEVDLADGSLPIIGYVVTPNVKRNVATGEYPVVNALGNVSVDLRGFAVTEAVAGAAIAAGELVGFGVDQKLHPAGVGVATIGTALIAAAAEDDLVDVLWQ